MIGVSEDEMVGLANEGLVQEAGDLRVKFKDAATFISIEPLSKTNKPRTSQG